MTRRLERLGRDYFQRLYTEDADPWHFATSSYEHQKYAATLAAMGPKAGKVLEIGCSIGVFTQLLALRSRTVLAVDIAETALAAARERCAAQRNIEFRQMELPDELPAGRFDVIVLSEVGYYWTLSDLDRFVDWLRTALAPGGRLILVHWTGLTDYPLTGDQVHDRIVARSEKFLGIIQRAVETAYRLDVLARSSQAEPTTGR